MQPNKDAIMPPQKLTPTFVNGLQPEAKDYSVYDTEVPGFFVKVTPKGKKVYFYWYRTRDGQARKYRLGNHGIVATPKARDMARQAAADVAAGGDPANRLAEQKAAPTVAEACQRFREWLTAHRKPSTAREYARVLERIIEPKWGKLKLQNLARSDVEALHHKLSATPYEANRMLAVLSSMLTKSIGWGLIPKGSNFCPDIERYPETKRGTVLSSEQMRVLGDALRAMQSQDESRAIANALLLLLFTGCRRGEVISLKWEYVDLEHSVIRLPDSKTGQRSHTLGRGAVALLSSIPKESGTPYIFPSFRDQNRPMSADTLSHAWVRLREAAGLPELRLHDLRHNRGSWGAKNHLGGYTLQNMLGHKNMQTTQRYLHPFDEALVEANNLVDKQFTELLGIVESDPVQLIAKP